MNRNLNNNWSELQKIPEEERGNIEFLCDDLCTPMCNRMGHYNIVNSCLLDRNDESCLGNYCTIDHDFSFYNMSNWPVTITPDMIDTYIENNYRHFKISGRGDGDCAILLRLLPYLIKPQYFSDAFIWAISRRFETEEKRKNKVK